MNNSKVPFKTANLFLAFVLAIALILRPSNTTLASTPPANVQTFIDTFLPYSQEQFAKYGIPVGVELAVGGFEGGCGTGAGPWTLNPQNNNWFNINYVQGDPWESGSYNCNGHNFRTYNSARDAWMDFGYFLVNDPNYSNFLGELSNPRKFITDFYPVYCGGCDPSTVLKIYNDWTYIYDLNNAIVTDIPDPDSYKCSEPGYIGFEDFKEGVNLTLGTISGVHFKTTGGYTWLVGDFASGNYNGKYPNGGYTSHGTHWAWLGVSQGSGIIEFPKGPASYFSLLVSNNTSVSLDAYDTNGNVIATAGPTSSNYNTGHMAELKITRATADMDHVIVHDAGNYFEIDDVCTNAPGTPNTINQIVDQTYFMQTGQSVFGNFLINLITGAKKYLHIIVGPFFSDVDIKLTRPDGSIISPTDPGITYSKTANQIDIGIEDAQPGQWRYEIIANQLDNGGENIPLGVYEETIIPTNLPPTISVPDSQVVQYSDPLSFNISASDPDSSDTLTLSASDLPIGLTFTDNGDKTGTVTGIEEASPGDYPVSFTATDPGGLSDTKSMVITVSQEDARATYTGPILISTANSKTSKAIVTLRATIRDITAATTDPAYDQYPGVITNATVNFVDRENSNAVVCSSSVTLIDSDSKTGTASCDWPVDLGKADSIEHTIGIQVNGYYTRDSSDEDAVIVVTTPDINFIAGGGFLVNQSSGGKYSGDIGKRTSFGLTIKYIPRQPNPKGWVTLIVRHNGHLYWIKTTSLASLVADPYNPKKSGTGVAEIIGKVSIVDVTNWRKPIIVATNASLLIDMKDNGEPGKTDTISISLWDKSGILLFSSNWNGTKTLPQMLSGGNLIVH